MSEELTVGAQGAETEVVQNNAEETTNAVAPKSGEEVDPQANANDGEQHEPKRKGGWQRKIEKLERELEVWREHALKTTTQQPTTTPAAKTEPIAEFKFDKPKPKPDDFRIEGTDTYDVAAFTEALNDWKYDEREARAEHSRKLESEKSKKADEEKKQSETVKAWRDRNAEAIKKYPDFNEAMKYAPPVSQIMHTAILESEVGADLAYHFATNEDEAERIAALGPWQQAREIAKLEAKFAPQGSAEQEAAKEEKEPPEPPVTKAPKPPTPVSKPGASAKPFDPVADADRLPYSEWKRLREAQLRKG